MRYDLKTAKIPPGLKKKMQVICTNHCFMMNKKNFDNCICNVNGCCQEHSVEISTSSP